jgi:hypothetical protein
MIGSLTLGCPPDMASAKVLRLMVRLDRMLSAMLPLAGLCAFFGFCGGRWGCVQ